MPRSGNSTAKQLANIEPHRFKGSGNPRGRPLGSKNKLAEDFFRDLHKAWGIMGQAALTATAWTQPADFVRVVAGLMPKVVDITVTNVHMERLTTRELEALVVREDRDPQDPVEAKEDPEGVFRVD